MLKQVLKLINIARFEKYLAPDSSTELKKLNLIYADNGKGKTTLTAVIRSLTTGNPILIEERKTLGGAGKTHAHFAIEGGEAIFDNSSWSKNVPDIEIFDSTFVNENVFSGETVEHGHKKNLYRFVVGEQGVTLANRVVKLDEMIREKNAEISQRELEIKLRIKSNIAVKDFVALGKVSDPDNLIKEKELEVESIRKSEDISKKSPLQKLALPVLPDSEIVKVMSTSIENLSKDAEEKTKEHIRSCMDENGESWIQQGLSYLKDAKCPMCGQMILDMSLVEAYQSYFNEAYLQFKEEIRDLLRRFNILFSDSALIYIQKIVTSNDALVDFWKQYVDGNFPGFQFEKIEILWKNLRANTQALFDKKIANPLDKISIDDATSQSMMEFQAVTKLVFDYNTKVDEINLLISEKKLATTGADLNNKTNELQKIKDAIVRYESDVDALCQSYVKSLEEKKILDKEKVTAKTKLDQFTTNIFTQYQKTINEYLVKFGAGFEIFNTSRSYTGGSPSSTYVIKINNTSVDLGNDQTVGEPCFRNVLSQGDKNALAFAFFLAKLDSDANLKDKVVIFDDPINSLDNHRRDCTKQEVVKIASKAKQTIVLSHDLNFLRAIWEYVNKDERENATTALSLQRDSTGTVITTWDIAKDTENPYVRDFRTLVEYAAGKIRASVDIARCIRPVLEGFIKTKFPMEFEPKVMLGQMATEIKQSKSTDTIYALQPKAQELIEINDYSKKFHHDTNENWQKEQINDGELKSYVDRALKFVRTI